MRLQIPFFKMRAAWRAEIVGRMPRRMTSSAISRPVQWLMGRSFGCSHAIATSLPGLLGRDLCWPSWAWNVLKSFVQRQF